MHDESLKISASKFHIDLHFTPIIFFSISVPCHLHHCINRLMNMDLSFFGVILSKPTKALTYALEVSGAQFTLGK